MYMPPTPRRMSGAVPTPLTTARCSSGRPVPDVFIEAARNPDWVVSAFNDEFERAIEQHIMGPRYGWPQVPLERHRCTQAAAAALALPLNLGGVAAALGL